MKHVTLLASAVVASLPLLACSQPSAPPAPASPPAPSTAGNAEKGFIGRQVDRALAEARRSPA